MNGSLYETSNVRYWSANSANNVARYVVLGTSSAFYGNDDNYRYNGNFIRCVKMSQYKNQQLIRIANEHNKVG